MFKKRFFLFLSISFCSLFCYAQGSVMLVAAEAAEVVIDGTQKVQLAAFSPFKVLLSTGEHTAVATSSRGARVSKTFIVEEDVQQLLQIEFPPIVIKKPVREALVVADVVLKVEKFERYDQNDPLFFRDESEIYVAFAREDSVRITVEAIGSPSPVFVELIQYHDHRLIYGSQNDRGYGAHLVSISETGIHIIRVGSLTDKTSEVHIRVERLPAGEASRNYISEVQKYVRYEAVQILDRTTLLLTSTTRERSGDGHNEAYVPLQVGNEISEWYYAAWSTYDKEATAPVLTGLSLYAQIDALIKEKGLVTAEESSEFKINLASVRIPTGTAPADVYLLTNENATKLVADKLFVCITEGSRDHVMSTLVPITCCKGNQYSIGVQNKDVFQDSRVTLEAVGIRKGQFLARPIDVELR